MFFLFDLFGLVAYISNWNELGLIWKALPDACLLLPEKDDQLRLGRTAGLPTIPSQQDSMKVDGKSSSQLTTAT